MLMFWDKVVVVVGLSHFATVQVSLFFVASCLFFFVFVFFPAFLFVCSLVSVRSVFCRLFRYCPTRFDV